MTTTAPATPATPPKGISPEQFAKRTGLTRRVVVSMVKAGRLPAVQWTTANGSECCRIPESEVARILAEMAPAPVPAASEVAQ